MNKIIVLRLITPSPEDDYQEVNDPYCPPLKKASIINFSCLRADTHLHTQACTLVHSVPAGEQVAHLYTPTDCSNGTRGPNYILMASIFLLASSREQEQNDVFFILAPVLFFWSWPMLFDHLKIWYLCKNAACCRFSTFTCLICLILIQNRRVGDRKY